MFMTDPLSRSAVTDICFPIVSRANVLYMVWWLFWSSSGDSWWMLFTTCVALFWMCSSSFDRWRFGGGVGKVDFVWTCLTGGEDRCLIDAVVRSFCRPTDLTFDGMSRGWEGFVDGIRRGAWEWLGVVGRGDGLVMTRLAMWGKFLDMFDGWMPSLWLSLRCEPGE